jgi:hypothetical protein
MHPVRLNKDGSLKKEFKPAIYVDTNFLRHYYNAEGAEFLFDENGNSIDPPWRDDLPNSEPSPSDLRHKLIVNITNPKDYFADFGCIRHFTTCAGWRSENYDFRNPVCTKNGRNDYIAS